MSGTPRRAFVVGGGVAGLVAAFGLRDRGFHVVLLESRGWLGGRAFSARDKVLDEPLDNGPHALLGCYRDFRALLRRIGCEDRFAAAGSLALCYRDTSGGGAALQLGRLPVPLAMPLALLRLPWPLATRWRAFLGMVAVLRRPPSSWSVADWLRHRRQEGLPAAWLWVPLCRAIMNVEPEFADARLFVRTLREAFSGSAGAAAFVLPKGCWSEVLGEPARRRLHGDGVEVRTGVRIGGLERAGNAVGALVRDDGRRIEVGGAVVVAAVPWHVLASWGVEREAAALGRSPIVSAHFRCERDADAPVDEGWITALVDGDPFHFLCRTPGAGRRAFALLAGGNRSFDGLAVEEVERLARLQLRRHYPDFDPAAKAVVRIRKEAAATFVAGPDVRDRRPPPGRARDGVTNLLVCGDWTDCGLPATLEGAARSANAMLRDLDRVSGA